MLVSFAPKSALFEFHSAQLRSNETAPLLNKYYWNEGILNEDKIHLVCFYTLDRDCVNKRGLYLSKEVLWIFVGQGAAELQSVKVGGQNKILLIRPARTKRIRTGPIGRILFWPPTLTASNLDASWSTETHSTSLERP